MIDHSNVNFARGFEKNEFYLHIYSLEEKVRNGRKLMINIIHCSFVDMLSVTNTCGFLKEVFDVFYQHGCAMIKSCSDEGRRQNASGWCRLLY